MYPNVRQLESYRIEAQELARLRAELRTAVAPAPHPRRRRRLRPVPATRTC
jgi:hypothetical protein